MITREAVEATLHFTLCGCIDYTDRFGAIKMPEGYSIFLNTDQSHFFWVRHKDGVESINYWCRFRCLRSAKNDESRESESL